MMNTEEAKKLLEDQRRENIEKCKQEISELLELHKCRFEVTVILRVGQVIPQIEIIAIE